MAPSSRQNADRTGNVWSYLGGLGGKGIGRKSIAILSMEPVQKLILQYRFEISNGLFCAFGSAAFFVHHQTNSEKGSPALLEAGFLHGNGKTHVGEDAAGRLHAAAE